MGSKAGLTERQWGRKSKACDTQSTSMFNIIHHLASMACNLIQSGVLNCTRARVHTHTCAILDSTTLRPQEVDGSPLCQFLQSLSKPTNICTHRFERMLWRSRMDMQFPASANIPLRDRGQLVLQQNTAWVTKACYLPHHQIFGRGTSFNGYSLPT